MQYHLLSSTKEVQGTDNAEVLLRNGAMTKLGKNASPHEPRGPALAAEGDAVTIPCPFRIHGGSRRFQLGTENRQKQVEPSEGTTAVVRAIAKRPEL